MWYSVRDILIKNTRELLNDPGLKTYQSMGVLPGSSRYRVAGAVGSTTNPIGLIFRDYEKRVRDDGGQTIVPLTSWLPLCAGKSISIPMISKTGLYLSGAHDGTLKIFWIGQDGTECDEVFDSHTVTGKADFSLDDGAILYVSRAMDPATQREVDAVFLTYLRTAQKKAVYYGAPTSQLSFPAFMSPDQFVVHDQPSKRLILIERSRVLN
jgi:hypothetical protein